MWTLLACRPPEAPAPVDLGVLQHGSDQLAGRPDLLELTRALVEDLDDQGPALRALISFDAGARGGAGSLSGLPIVVKDNVDVAGMPTTAGSLALAGHVPADDAAVVARIRAAGAAIVGKANLSEWANFRGEHSISGWSAVGGFTRNPYVLDRSPCGSSSGSAVAVAAGLAVMAVGTETDGSILCPSSMNGVVGVKPTVGLVSADGIVPIAHSQDTAGPMARTVADAALLLEVMAERPVDLRGGLRQDALRGARIGVARELDAFDPCVTALLDAAVADLQRLGATVVDAPLAVPAEVGALEEEVLLHEFAPDLAGYLATVDGLDTLADLVAWNEAHAAEELRWFGQELFRRALEHPRDDGYAEAAARAKRLCGPEGIDAALAAAGVEAIVAPTNGPAWRVDAVNGDRAWTGGTSTITAVSGYPAVTVPMGQVEGLPVGITFLGTAWSEARLLALAHAYELGTRHRRPPAFRPSVE